MTKDWRPDPSTDPEDRNDVLAALLETDWRMERIRRVVRTPDPDYPAAGNPPFRDVPGWGIINDA